MAWACMLGLQLSLKWSRTIVAVMASVGVLAGICSVLGVCGFPAANSFPYGGTLIAAFSPFTAICVLIDPLNFASKTFDPSSGDYPFWPQRTWLIFCVFFASGIFCAIVWGMYRSMVKNFDMIIRRQHQ
jgi:hypothetical protein